MTTDTLIHKTTIGDTGYDLYNWSFKEGNRVQGKGWSVSIPNGFKKISPKENRIFELIPDDNSEEPLVQIIPNDSLPGPVIDDWWPYHLTARKYLPIQETMEIIEKTSEFFQLFGLEANPIDLMFFSTDEVCGVYTIEMPDWLKCNHPYYFQGVIYGSDTVEELRVMVYDSISPEQAEQLKQSIQSWMKTFHFDKPNNRIPKTAPLDDPKIIENLKNKDTDLFDEAISRALEESTLALFAAIIVLNHRFTNDLIDRCQAEPLIQEGFSVLEFYLSKSENLINRAKTENVSPYLMDTVYDKIINELADEKTYMQQCIFTEEVNKIFHDSFDETIEKLKKEMAENKKKMRG
ncbi:MAG: hypothetical protein J6E46_02680 [Faecalicoccus sp.]|nr:hypothetical protein [Faecalicoccus sp.]